MGQWEPSDIAHGKVNGATTLGNRLAGPQKVKHRVSLWLLGIYTKRNENTNRHKSLFKSVHGSITHESQKAEMTQVSII